jgi:cell wall-associated NlpC family hydrolase
MRGHPGSVFVIALTIVISACASTGYTPQPFPTPAAAPTPNSANPNSPTNAQDPNTQNPNAQNPNAQNPNAQNPLEKPRPNSQGPRLNGPALAYSLTGTALSLRGTPYRNGGHDPSGFDCSGFVSYVFGQYGIAVPRTVNDQYHAGREVDPQQGLQPGDLVFFTTVSPGASHVGILIGGDEFLHAPSSTGEVRVERLSGPYWSTRFIGARRVM